MAAQWHRRPVLCPVCLLHASASLTPTSPPPFGHMDRKCCMLQNMSFPVLPHGINTSPLLTPSQNPKPRADTKSTNPVTRNTTHPTAAPQGYLGMGMGYKCLKASMLTISDACEISHLIITVSYNTASSPPALTIASIYSQAPTVPIYSQLQYLDSALYANVHVVCDAQYNTASNHSVS